MRCSDYIDLHVDVATEYNFALVCTCTCRYRRVLTTVVTVVFLVVFHWCSCLECHVHVP